MYRDNPNIQLNTQRYATTRTKRYFGLSYLTGTELPAGSDNRWY